jgi:hypothetical protein
MNTLAIGSIVRYAVPNGIDESALRFRVLEASEGRVTMRCLNLPDWSPELAPIETVASGDVVPVDGDAFQLEQSNDCYMDFMARANYKSYGGAVRFVLSIDRAAGEWWLTCQSEDAGFGDFQDVAGCPIAADVAAAFLALAR